MRRISGNDNDDILAKFSSHHLVVTQLLMNRGGSGALCPQVVLRDNLIFGQ